LRSIDLMNRLREAISIGISDSDDLLQLAMTVTWLALDDLVTERPTSYVIEQLYVLLETRRSSEDYTLFTSNFNLCYPEVRWEPDGISPGGFHPGRRMNERMTEYCEIVSVRGRNLRRAAESMPLQKTERRYDN
jgi:DNA replication protein DnaC